MSTNALGSDFPLSSNQASERSVDAGTLELGVESTWTRDETFVTVAEQSGSLRVEPSTSDQLSAVTAEGALGAPPNPSTPLTNVNEVVHAKDHVMNVETGCAECGMNVGGVLRSYSERFTPKG
jgi:hypothetical protein